MNKIEITDLTNHATPFLQATMDNIKVGRSKKSDKARETYERNGGFSQKHVRQMEAMAEKRAAMGNAAVAGSKQTGKGSK